MRPLTVTSLSRAVLPPGSLLGGLLLAACNDATVPLDTGEALCGGPIYVPRSGIDTSEPVLADVDEARFGTLAPDPAQVHLSWADDPATTISIVWRTDGDTLASQVQYGVSESYGATATGASFFVAGGEEWGRIHEARLCGLTPGSTVHYRVGGEGHWSPDRTFTAAPPAGSTERFRFLMAGDSRDNQAVWAQILDAAEAHAPEFYVFTGDAVDLGTNLEEWDAWYAAGDGHYDEHVVLNAHGNHEFQTQTYYALVALPGNEQWYSFDYGPAHFTALNDTVAAADDFQIQADWMADDLAAATTPWRFVYHHMPAYTSCERHAGNTTLQALWSPVEEAAGVAVDFTGHNHNYERSYAMRDRVATEGGTTYVVSGGAGADLYDNQLANAYTAVAAVTDNYVIVDVDGASVSLTAYDLAGNVLDTWSMAK